MRHFYRLVGGFMVGGILAVSQLAHAADYPVLHTYQALASRLVADTAHAGGGGASVALIKGTTELIRLGDEIMKLYSLKNPGCAAQFLALEQVLPKLTEMSLADVETLYHSGKALPAGPKHCYFVRDQVIHPVLNVIRLKGTVDEQVRGEIIDDFNEVIEHLSVIQQYLDHPPK